MGRGFRHVRGIRRRPRIAANTVNDLEGDLLFYDRRVSSRKRCDGSLKPMQNPRDQLKCVKCGTRYPVRRFTRRRVSEAHT